MRKVIAVLALLLLTGCSAGTPEDRACSTLWYDLQQGAQSYIEADRRIAARQFSHELAGSSNKLLLDTAQILTRSIENEGSWDLALETAYVRCTNAGWNP